jgi:hypothetical protein
MSKFLVKSVKKSNPIVSSRKKSNKKLWITISLILVALLISLVFIYAKDLRNYVSNRFSKSVEEDSELSLAPDWWGLLIRNTPIISEVISLLGDHIFESKLKNCLKKFFVNGNLADMCDCILNHLVYRVNKSAQGNHHFFGNPGGSHQIQKAASLINRIFNAVGCGSIVKTLKTTIEVVKTYGIYKMVSTPVEEILSKTLPRGGGFTGRGFIPKNPAVTVMEHLTYGQYQQTLSYQQTQKFYQMLVLFALVGLTGFIAYGVLTVSIPIIGYCGSVIVTFATTAWSSLSSGATVILQQLATVGAKPILATLMLGASLNAQGGQVSATNIEQAMTEYGFDLNNPNAPQNPNKKAKFEAKIKQAAENGRFNDVRVCGPGITGIQRAPQINLISGTAPGYTRNSGTVTPSSTPGHNDCNYGFVNAKVLKGSDVTYGGDNDQMFIQTDQGMSVGVRSGLHGSIESDATYDVFMTNRYSGVNVHLPVSSVYDDSVGFGFFSFNGRVGHRVGVDCREIRDNLDNYAVQHGRAPLAAIVQITFAITEDNCDPIFVTALIDCTGVGSVTTTSQTQVNTPGTHFYGTPSKIPACSSSSHQCRTNSDCANFGAGSTCTGNTGPVSNWCMCVSSTGVNYPVQPWISSGGIPLPPPAGGTGATCDSNLVLNGCQVGNCVNANEFCSPATCKCVRKIDVPCGSGPLQSNQQCNPTNTCPGEKTCNVQTCECIDPPGGTNKEDNGAGSESTGNVISNLALPNRGFTIAKDYNSDGTYIYETVTYPSDYVTPGISVNTYSLAGILLSTQWTGTNENTLTTYTYDSLNRLVNWDIVDSNRLDLHATYSYDDVNYPNLPIPVSLNGYYYENYDIVTDRDVLTQYPLKVRFVITPMTNELDNDLYSVAEYDDLRGTLEEVTIVKHDSSITGYRNPTIPSNENAVETYSADGTLLNARITKPQSVVWTDSYTYNSAGFLATNLLKKEINGVNVKQYQSSYVYSNGDNLLRTISTLEDNQPLIDINYEYKSNGALSIPSFVYLTDTRNSPGTSYSYWKPNF